MLHVIKKFKKEVNKEHFPLDLEKGLTSEQVQQRLDDGLVNKTKKHVTKSYLRIVYENVFNFFSNFNTTRLNTFLSITDTVNYFNILIFISTLNFLTNIIK